MIHELTKGNGMLETIDSGNKHWERKSTHTHIYIYIIVCFQFEWFQGQVPGTLPLVHRLNPWIVWNWLLHISINETKCEYIHMICTCYAQRPKGMMLIVRRVCYDEDFVWRLPLLPGVAGNLMSTLAADGLKATELKNEYLYLMILSFVNFLVVLWALIRALILVSRFDRISLIGFLKHKWYI